MRKINLLLVLLLTAGISYAQDLQWSIDKNHSTIGFTTTWNLFIDVDGRFNDYEVSFNPTSRDFNNTPVSFVAQVASISTQNDRRDDHLKSDDFFNAEQFPELKFDGRLTKNGEQYALEGNMTIRDVTKQVSLPVTYMGSVDAGRGATRHGFKIGGTIDRMDFNLKWGNTMPGGDLVVADEVELDLTVAVNEAPVNN